MGSLLDVLRSDGKKPAPSVFLDFEHVQPTPDEEVVHKEVQAILDQSNAILDELDEYKGAGDHIRTAISQPSNQEVQNQTWMAVCPLVVKLQKFFQFSLSLDGVLHKLLLALCAEDPMTSLHAKQALAKQFAEILHFVLKFDELKMSNPAIQNDFSYYRRTLNRMKMSNPGASDIAVVSDEEANRMSLFYAYPTPMLKSISDSAANFVKENRAIPVENTTDTLSVMAGVCREMIENPEYTSRFENPDTILFCQRVMVGAIILYDLVHSVGAFSKKNPSIDIRASIRALKKHDSPHVENLMNALRFTTKHLNDDDTPKAVKMLLTQS